MNKRMMLKIGIGFIISMGIGFIAALLLLEYKDTKFLETPKEIMSFMQDKSLGLVLIIWVFLLLPGWLLHFRGKKIFKETEKANEEAMDDIEKKSNKYMDISSTLNGCFVVLNMMIFGMFFKHSDQETIFLVLFLIGSFNVTALEIATIKFAQKNDERLKGDPSSMKFMKDFVESCDEAQQLKIYKAGFKSMQFQKNVSLVMLVLAIFLNLVLDTGVFPILMSSVFMLTTILSYSFYATRSEI